MDKPVLKVPNQMRRRKEQLYVFFILESPLNDGLNYSNHRFNSFFNLTMTYRLDSDLVRPYGWFYPKRALHHNAKNPELPWLNPTVPSQELQAALKELKKPKLVAWIASNCDTHSDREDYVTELKKHIQVDVYGKCGDQECGPANGGASNVECDAMIEENYKFFLAFENSLCTDYVTEKFYRTLSRLIVPVVLGSANYTRLAPPGSFINALNYPSPSDLAKELKRLAGDHNAYDQHFWWKDQGVFAGPLPGAPLR